MLPVRLSADVQDAVGVAATRILSVTSNDAPNGKGDGNTASDWRLTGDMTLDLRAERAGNGGDRSYVITVESRDAAGNATTATVVVVAPHDQRNR
jgi:hypothetical protein